MMYLKMQSELYFSIQVDQTVGTKQYGLNLPKRYVIIQQYTPLYLWCTYPMLRVAAVSSRVRLTSPHPQGDAGL